MVADGDGNLYAGGLFSMAGEVSASHIAKWDGSVWSPLGTGTNREVRALCRDGFGNLYAGGDFTTAGGVTVNGIAKWDGAAWSALGSGMSHSSGSSFTVNALVCDAEGNLYAGGAFTHAGGGEVNRIAKWNGTAWSGLGSGVNLNYVLALALDDMGTLYAGGDFTTAGGVAASRVAKWDGTSWSALGSGLTKSGFGMGAGVAALTVGADGVLFAGGEFDHAGGAAANRVARWDGKAWSAVGSGMNSVVNALAVAGNELHAGGEFIVAGGKVSAYMAHVSLSTNSAPGDLLLSNDSIAEGQPAGTTVGILSAIDEDPEESHTFGLVSGEGDSGNAAFAIEGDLLKAAEVFDYATQNTYSIRLRATDAGGMFVEKVFLVTVTEADRFEAWSESLPPDERGEADDPGGYGIPNLLRYAFNLDPLQPDRSGLPQVGRTTVVVADQEQERLSLGTVETMNDQPQEWLTLSFTRRKNDATISYTIEASDDLLSWNPLLATEEIIDDGNGETETVTINDPDSGEGKTRRFLRLNVAR